MSADCPISRLFSRSGAAGEAPARVLSHDNLPKNPGIARELAANPSHANGPQVLIEGLKHLAIYTKIGQINVRSLA